MNFISDKFVLNMIKSNLNLRCSIITKKELTNFLSQEYISVIKDSDTAQQLSNIFNIFIPINSRHITLNSGDSLLVVDSIENRLTLMEVL